MTGLADGFLDTGSKKLEKPKITQKFCPKWSYQLLTWRKLKYKHINFEMTYGTC